MPPEAEQSNSGDAAFLQDMLNACERVERFVAKVSVEEYRASAILRSAVERQIAIIGEAAQRVSDRLKAAHPEVPRRPVIAQRHILTHEYGDLDDALVWRVATVHVPSLRRQLEGLVPKRSNQ